VVIVAHNHPPGDVHPSEGDITTTRQLATAGHILGIPLADHIIVGGTNHFSFREQEFLGPAIIELIYESLVSHLPAPCDRRDGLSVLD
jgi:RadC-like JAB domain